VVLSAHVVAGEVVETSKVLFVVVDPSRIWLTLHVGPEDARRVSVGQPVSFRPDGLQEDSAGRVTWVGTAADETTRTVPVRAELANDSGQLRASTFGRGRIILREAKDAVVVPHEAVKQLDGMPVVFVRDQAFLKPGGPKAFHVRPVRVGAKDAENTEVVTGLEPGEVVATKGSGLLLDELKRSLAARSAAE
jgi:cobalt-zinc-cadmium efflux system membrane fusion protein